MRGARKNRKAQRSTAVAGRAKRASNRDPNRSGAPERSQWTATLSGRLDHAAAEAASIRAMRRRLAASPFQSTFTAPTLKKPDPAGPRDESAAFRLSPRPRGQELHDLPAPGGGVLRGAAGDEVPVHHHF